MKAPVALIAGLTIVCMGVAASSGSAATISPAGVDFGRFLIGKQSPPRTFIVTVGSGDGCRSPGPAGECYPIVEGLDGGFTVGNALAFFDLLGSSSCHGLVYLTATSPSCTIVVNFEPDRPGVLRGTTGPNDYDPSVLGGVTGIGLLPRSSIYCRSPKKGGIHKKNLSRWCVNRKKKKK